MSQQLFNAEGTSAKISELYALSDADLKVQTEAIRVDFKSWMHWHFTLNAQQRTFLASMEYPKVQVLAEDLADCIQFRLLLSFTWPPLHPIGSKFVQPVSTLIRTYDPDGGYTVRGQLRIEIGYK
ncbi:hypothetical protein [Pedobacter panaciterrae]